MFSRLRLSSTIAPLSKLVPSRLQHGRQDSSQAQITTGEKEARPKFSKLKATLKRWIVFIIFFCLSGGMIILTLGIGLKTVVLDNWRKSRMNEQASNFATSTQISTDRKLFLGGTIASWGIGSVFDPTLSVNWLVIPAFKVDGSTTFSYSVYTNEAATPRHKDYLNPSLAFNCSFPFQDYQWNWFNTTVRIPTSMWAPNRGSVSDKDNEQVVLGKLISSASDSVYPFDRYTAVLTIVATEAGNPNVKIPIADAAIDSPNISQWTFSVTTQALPDNSSTTIRFAIKRHTVARLTALIFFFLNWLVVLSILYMTVVYTFEPRRPKLAGNDSLTLMFTALFALPAVRNAMPGVPVYGCLIDFFGIIPNLAIISICIITHLLFRLHREGKVKSDEDNAAQGVKQTSAGPSPNVDGNGSAGTSTETVTEAPTT